MIAGVGIFGVVAASAAAWFISADQRQDRHQQAETITTLTAEITDVLAFGELFDTFATLRSLIIANDRLLACGE